MFSAPMLTCAKNVLNKSPLAFCISKPVKLTYILAELQYVRLRSALHSTLEVDILPLPAAYTILHQWLARGCHHIFVPLHLSSPPYRVLNLGAPRDHHGLNYS